MCSLVEQLETAQVPVVGKVGLNGEHTRARMQVEHAYGRVTRAAGESTVRHGEQRFDKVNSTYHAHTLAIVHIPQANGLVGRPAGQHRIAHQFEGEHGVCVTDKLAVMFTVVVVVVIRYGTMLPEAYGLIAGRARQALARLDPLEREHEARVALERAHTLVRVHVPELDAAVLMARRARQHVHSIGTRHMLERVDLLGVAHERLQTLVCLQRPDADGPVARTARHALTGHSPQRVHAARVADQGGQALAAVQVPDLDGAVGRGARHSTRRRVDVEQLESVDVTGVAALCVHTPAAVVDVPQSNGEIARTARQ